MAVSAITSKASSFMSNLAKSEPGFKDELWENWESAMRNKLTMCSTSLLQVKRLHLRD